MSGLVLVSVSGIFESLLSHWQMGLFVILSVLLLLCIMFQKFRRAFWVLLISAAAVGVALLVDLIIEAVQWKLLDFIDFCVRWVPTILFSSIVLFSTWLGAKRGLRKSLILLLQAVLAAALWLTLYFVCVNGTWADKTLLNVVNFFMGGKGALQSELGVGGDSLRAVFAEWLPGVIDKNSQFGILIAENSAYVYTLADMAFHVVMALICYVFYLITVFLLYLVYHIFYSERKYKRKKNLAFANNRTDSSYKKRRLGGGAVGLLRGLAVAFISVSFMGSAFYMAAGGTGNGKSPDYSFDNSDTDAVYSIYRSLESYGEQGIFKVLNMMSDPDDTPYYLFAADLILSGKLEDKENGIKENIIFREEIGAFTGFARDTFSLLMKYGEDELTPVLNGNTTGGFYKVLDVMKEPQFQTEFDALIDDFDTKTYLINFSMSLATSIVAHIDEMEFASSLDKNTCELLKVMFRKGYLSDTIPDDKELKRATGKQEAEGKDIRPYFGVSAVLEKSDAKILLKTVLEFLSSEGKSTLDAVRSVLPGMEGLSMLSEGKRDKINPVFGRMYCFLENLYLTPEGQDGIRYSEIKDENVLWTDEIRSLLDVSENVFEIYDDVKSVGESVLDKILHIFSDENENRKRDLECYDIVCERVTASRLLGKVLSTSYIYNEITGTLSNLYGKEVYLPKNTAYANEYDGETLVRRGETYYLLYGLRALGTGSHAELIRALVGNTELATSELIEILAQSVSESDEFGNSLAYYLTESQILRSTVSVALMTLCDDVIYVPRASLQTDEKGEVVNVIAKEEFRYLFEHIAALSDFIQLNVVGNYLEAIDEFLNNESSYALVEESRIFEGTMARLFSEKLSGTNRVVVPKRLVGNLEGWITVNNISGELRKFVKALQNLNVSMKDFAGGEISTSELLECINALSESQIDIIFNSSVMHYTVSDYLLAEDVSLNGLSLIVPTSALQTLTDDVCRHLVKKREAVQLFREISELGISDGSDISHIVVQIAAHRKTVAGSNILSASVIYTMVSNSEICGLLNFSPNYIEAGAKEELQRFNSSNPWKTEFERLICALDEIFTLSGADDSFVFNDDSMIDALNNTLRNLNAEADSFAGETKLGVCYNSEVMRNKITVRLDGIFRDNGVVGEDIIVSAKDGAYYSYSELQSLSYALDLFDLDILELNGDELSGELKDRLLSVNEPLENENGKTMLDLVYPSVVISHILSNELDKAIDGLAEESVLAAIKGGEVRYSQSEISNFVNAVKEFGISSVDDIELYDFKNLQMLNEEGITNPDATRLHNIYQSGIAAGIITKSVKESIEKSDILQDHESAYETQLRIYRECEIESIIRVFGNAEDVSDYSFDISLARECVYDGAGVTHSYIIVASVSAELLKNEGLVIPKTVLDAENSLLPRELAYIIDMFEYLRKGDADIDEWEIELRLPTPELREAMIKSVVMRATLTLELSEMNVNAAVSVGRVQVSQDFAGNEILILGEEETEALTDALEICNGEQGSYELPEFTLESICAFDETTLLTLFESDIIRYEICGVVLKNTSVREYLTTNGYLTEETAYRLQSGDKTMKESTSAQYLYEALNNLVG